LPADIDFNKQIRPILADNCYKCHNRQEAKRESCGWTRLELIQKGGKDGKIFTAPANPSKKRYVSPDLR